MNLFNTISAIKRNGGLLTLAVLLGLVLGFGLRNCSPFPSYQVMQKDSVNYNITTIDSTYIEWDTTEKTITKPVPSMVVASPNKKEGTADDCNCDCITDSIRTYVGRVKVGDIGFVFYNLKAIGTITDINFTNQIGVQNKVRIVQSDKFKSSEKIIDKTPFIRVYAGTEINPMQLNKSSVYADANLRKWQFGYKYQIGAINPHHVKVGFKIFDL